MPSSSSVGSHDVESPPILIAPGVSLSLEEFITRVKKGGTCTAVGQLVIQRVQLRKSKREPFRHEYVLVYVESHGSTYVIRLDR